MTATKFDELIKAETEVTVFLNEISSFGIGVVEGVMVFHCPTGVQIVKPGEEIFIPWNNVRSIKWERTTL